MLNFTIFYDVLEVSRVRDPVPFLGLSLGLLDLFLFLFLFPSALVRVRVPLMPFLESHDHAIPFLSLAFPFQPAPILGLGVLHLVRIVGVTGPLERRAGTYSLE